MFTVRILSLPLILCALVPLLGGCVKPYTPATKVRIAKGGVMATIPLDDLDDGRPPAVSPAPPADPKAERDYALEGYRPER
jgi:hypothetical protein